MSATKDSLANPGPLGLCGFALTTWLLCLINAGIFDSSNLGLVFGMAFAFGGTAQMIAGMFEFKKATPLDLPHLSVMVRSGGLGHYLSRSLKAKPQRNL
ncbi:inner membrane protein YaaH [Rodentibacter pneumotropicus]|uniref:Inner membrane protein YaaH n=1 Tax=Rodentibacter pneumotropicus TaxID=758 RepID=A0A3S4XZG0_9PAST|nr:inner membrane protein YaaH [Rodentibacter pneumotropicus]